MQDLLSERTQSGETFLLCLRQVFCIRKKIYIVYAVLRLNSEQCEMRNYRDKEEIRWQVVKAMLDEFPTLRKKVRNYITATEN
jgi:hypothetical protein